MYKAIRKYGEENIKWEILCECDNFEDMKEKEIFFIKLYNSTSHKFGYNMVCGDKEDYNKRENFNKEYQLDIIKRKLISNGHDPSKYIEITDELSLEILNDYGKIGIRGLANKYKISRQRLTRFIKSKDIEIIKDMATITNSIKIDDSFIKTVIQKWQNGKTIKDISSEEGQTIQTISRILHDSNIRKSKRFKNGKRYDGRQPKKSKPNNTIGH